MQRIGILGGTFDPIHYGHLAIAEEAGRALGLATVLLIPAARQPLKREPHSASPQQRWEMVARACAENELLQPSDIELRREPPSYTVDTLRELYAGYPPDTELWLILGADAVVSFPHWHAADQILQLARLAVVARPGASVDLQALDQSVPGLHQRTTLLEGPHLDISATDLRQRIANNRPVRYQLPDDVLAYIRQHNLYRQPEKSSAAGVPQS